MAKTLVTGATGFIGSHVARALLERGDDVRCSVRPTSKLDALEGADVEIVHADATDPVAFRRALKGVDRVFHIAGLTSMRASAERLREANVIATRNVLAQCLKADVERVVYASSVAAIGPADDPAVPNDETAVWHSVGLPYADSKYVAETEALRAVAKGLPVVITNPAHVFGWGDHLHSSTDVVRRFLLRRIPAYPDRGAINVVDVDDVARGHLLADVHGRPGERYILGDRNYTWERLFADLGRISGIEPPAIRAPADVALALAALGERLPGRDIVTANEVRGVSQYWIYKSDKARRELRWRTRSHEETVERTVQWYLEREGERIRRAGRRQPAALRLAGFGLRQVERVL